MMHDPSLHVVQGTNWNHCTISHHFQYFIRYRYTGSYGTTLPLILVQRRQVKFK